MKKLTLYIFLLLINFISINAKEIEIVTENYPPFQWRQNGHIIGPSTEVIHAISKKVGIPYSIKMYPWPRAYYLALNGKNVLIYSITKSKKRENIFKWIGTIMFRDIYIWKLKERKDIVINTIEDAKKYKIAGINKDAKSQYLLGNGFIKKKNIFIVYTNETIIKLLYARRTDLIIDNNDLESQVKKSGFDFDKLERVLLIEELSGEVYAAFSLMTSDEVVEQYQKALTQLKNSGEFDKIIKKYK